MKKLLISIVAVLALGIAAKAAEMPALTAVEAPAIECSALLMAPEAPLAAGLPSTSSVKIGGTPDPLVATILAVVPVTSWLGIHRMYMGTEVLPVILNIVTADGFGIVYLVDAVAMVVGCIEGDITKYCNNPRWLMWANLI